MKIANALMLIRDELDDLAATMEVVPSERFDSCYRVLLKYPILIAPIERDTDLHYIAHVLKMVSVYYKIEREIDDHSREVHVLGGSLIRIQGRRSETVTELFEIPKESNLRYKSKRKS